MLIKETQKPKDGGNTQMEFVTTLELSPGSEAVVEHQFEANRAWDLDKGRGILLASNSAVLTIIIATWIFSSGHISTSNPNRRQPTHEILVFKKIVKQKSLSLAFSLFLSDFVCLLERRCGNNLSNKSILPLLSLVRPVKDDVVQNRTMTLDSPFPFSFSFSFFPLCG